MNVVVVAKTEYTSKDAMLWLKDKYAEYPDGSIVSSFMSQDNSCITAYVVVDKAKLNPTEKKLIKIT